MAIKPVFSDVEFMTAAEKGKVARQWGRFLQHLAVQGYSTGDGFNLFPNALYEHLHQHCGYIAHYDRHGFFVTYFTNPAACFQFIAPWVDGQKLHDMLGDYRDIGEHMIFVAKKYGPDILTNTGVAVREHDLALARQLFMKHGVRAPEVCRG